MKLWEALKELEENPDKKFKSVNYNQEDIIISMGAGCYDLPFRVLDSNRDWQEIKQPVTWQEAIEAWANGKPIKCVINGGSTLYKSKSGLQDSLGWAVSPVHIKNGTWYIEED